MVLFVFVGNAQETSTEPSYIRKPSLGISFFFNDYQTPARIRASTLSSVLANKQNAKLKDMSPGIAISYFKGIHSHVDFAATIAGSFVDYAVNELSGSKDRFLLEADASLDLKLLSEKYWVSPYLSVGAGISKYGVYYGTFIPVGWGLKLNIFDEAHIFINSQYRIPVTTGTANYHFMHGFGIAGIIGNK